MIDRTPRSLVVAAVLAALAGLLATRAPTAAGQATAAPQTPAAAAAAAAGARADAGDARPDKFEFLRFAEDDKGGGTLQTAIATYRNAGGVEVHLVAAVHVGERAYYEALAKTFDGYDALLYELVKSKDAAVPGAKAAEPDADAPPPARIRGATAIGGLQALLKNALQLESQLEMINYDRPNFIHADLDGETFNKLQDERGESLFGLMLRSVLSEMKRQQSGKGAPPITMFDILLAMTSPDSARQYKLLLARQFKDMDAQIQGLEGEEGTVLVAERNKAALKVLERTIGQGKRSIGVFYGAAHMRGIEEALVGKMGFTRAGVEWRTAWDMRAPADGQAKPAKPAAAKPRR
jgi:hypothetical protein